MVYLPVAAEPRPAARAGSAHHVQSWERGRRCSGRGMRAVGRLALGEVWRSSSWAGECHLCCYLLDREAVVEGLWSWGPFKFLTAKIASACGACGNQAPYSNSNASTWSKDISGQCNKWASKWIPRAIYHEPDTQAELSAALLKRKIAPWQLVYQCQGDSLIYWRPEIAASGGRKIMVIYSGTSQYAEHAVRYIERCW